MLAGTQPRVSRRIRLRIAFAPDALHIDSMREGSRVHEAEGPVQEWGEATGGAARAPSDVDNKELRVTADG